MKNLPQGRTITGGGGAAALAFMCLNVADQSVTAAAADTANKFAPLSALITDFSLVGGGAFTLAANGVVNYSGPDISVLVSLNLTGFFNGIIGSFSCAVALNDDLVGQTPDADNIVSVRAGVQAFFPTGAGDMSLNQACQRLLNLTDGDFILPVVSFLIGTGSSDISILFLTMSILQVST